MASTAATLVVKVVSDTKQAVAGLDQTAKSTSQWRDKLGAASKAATVGLVALGGAAIYAGKAAAEDAQSQAILANTMTKSAGATSAQVKATEDFIAKTALATGVADDQLRPALGNLVRATGDVELSQKALQTALDISAATGKDVTAVTTAMAKGYGGNETALNRLLPSVTKVAEKTGDFDAVMRQAAAQTEGAMAASANSAAGQMDRMTVAMDEATESLGTALLPAMSVFAQVLARVANFVNNNSKAVQILVVVLASMLAGIVALNYALKAYQTITVAVGIVQNAVWLTNPIVLVVLAVVALVAAMVLLYKKSATFRRFVDAMWAGIKVGAKAAAAVFKAAWNVAFDIVKRYISVWVAYFKLVFGVIKGLVKLVVAVFKGDWRGALDAVRGILGSFKDFFRNIFQALPGPVQTLIVKIKDGLVGAFRIAKAAIGPILDAVKQVFDNITGAVENLIDAVQELVGWIGNIDFPSPPSWLSKIPGVGSLAAPAPVGSPAVGRFAAPRVGARGGGVAISGGGAITINVTGALDPEATARQIRRILDGHDRRIGLKT